MSTREEEAYTNAFIKCVSGGKTEEACRDLKRIEDLRDRRAEEDLKRAQREVERQVREATR